MSKTTPLCITCVWWEGDEHAAAAEHVALCAKRRVRTYADDTCGQYRDAAVRTVHDMEPIGPILARVLRKVERKRGRVA